MEQTSTGVKPAPDALIAALRENWEHARFVGMARLRHFNLYWLAFAAVLAFTLRVEEGFLAGLEKYWPMFLILGVLSVYTLYSVVKLSLEQGNHVRAIKWVSEELGLNKSAEGKELSQHEFTGYMALPLPLALRVRRAFWNIIT